MFEDISGHLGPATLTHKIVLFSLSLIQGQGMQKAGETWDAVIISWIFFPKNNNKNNKKLSSNLRAFLTFKLSEDNT